jgi:hypothetical protein
VGASGRHPFETVHSHLNPRGNPGANASNLTGVPTGNPRPRAGGGLHGRTGCGAPRVGHRCCQLRPRIQHGHARAVPARPRPVRAAQSTGSGHTNAPTPTAHRRIKTHKERTGWVSPYVIEPMYIISSQYVTELAVSGAGARGRRRSDSSCRMAAAAAAARPAACCWLQVRLVDHRPCVCVQSVRTPVRAPWPVRCVWPPRDSPPSSNGVRLGHRLPSALDPGNGRLVT